MKKLTLQITRENFEYIMMGEQRVEHRYIYPSNEKRYINSWVETNPETGEEMELVQPIDYDTMYLINGRRKDAPRILVEIIDAKYVQIVDENGVPYTYEQDGKTYIVEQIWYCLGKVLEKENCENFEFKFHGIKPFVPSADDLAFIEEAENPTDEEQA